MKAKNQNAFDLLTMGEIMLRLSPPGSTRLSDGNEFEKHAGGAELNVASGVAQLGLRSGIISKIPDNEMGYFMKNRIRFMGVSDDYLIYDSSPEARLGLYYYESGAAPRKATAVYDRMGSSVNRIRKNELPSTMWKSTRMFHTSGITLALSPALRKITIETIRRFHKCGTVISFDVNYRARLWDEEEARKTIEEILPMTDILFVSEESSRRMFRKTGTLEEIQKSYAEQYGVKIVLSTQRTVKSPQKHDFTSTIYDAASGRFYTEEPYRDIDVVDRIGSGDAYVAGALFGLLKYDDPEKALWFGNAMSSVKETVPGDLPSSNFREISGIIETHHGHGSGSEMNR